MEQWESKDAQSLSVSVVPCFYWHDHLFLWFLIVILLPLYLGYSLIKLLNSFFTFNDDIS